MVGGPRPPPGVQLSMPPVVPIEPYEDLGPCRYGGPCRRPKEIKDAHKITQAKTTKPFLERVPLEILCGIINKLPGKDLKNVVICNRALNEIVTPILYKRSRLTTLKALFILAEEDLPKDYARNVFIDQEKNKESDKKFEGFLATLPKGKNASLITRLECLGIDSRTWKLGHELLRRFPNLEDTGFPWLACHRGFSLKRRSASLPREPKDSNGVQLDSEEQRADRLIAEFGDTTMKNLTQASLNWDSIKTFVKILSHLPKLQKLFTCIPDPEDSKKTSMSKADFKQIIPAISATVGSALVRLQISDPSAIENIGAFMEPLGDRSKFPSLRIFNVTRLDSTLDGKKLRIGRAKFLYETYRASKRHGQWTFPHKDLRLGVLELGVLEAQQMKELYLWLRKNIPKWDGEVLLEEIGILDPIEVTPDLEGFLQRMDSIADEVPLKLCIDSTYPPSSKNRFLGIVKKFAPRLVQLTVSPSEIDPGDDDDDEEFITAVAETAFMEWCNFLEAFLPLCKNMHTFRTVSQPGGGGTDILLAGKLEPKIAKLCREHKLRHLDIDLASLPQPETPGGVMLFDGEEQSGDGPRRVIQGLAWISTQRGTMMKPDFKNCLQNLRSLKMKNLFIFRQVEMIWFTNLTAKLKNLELIEIHGLVWHLGYEKGSTDSEDDDDNEGDKIQNEEDEWEDMESGAGEIPSIEEVGEQIGKLGLVTRLDADSSLLSWLPEDSESDSDSEPEKDEDGRKKSGSRTLDSDDDDDDAHSTDSGFGSDPRFTKSVNEDLRVTRLKGWICKVLVSTAKKTGGRCRKVVIEDLRINGKGLDPWTLEDSFSAYSGSDDEWW